VKENFLTHTIPLLDPGAPEPVAVDPQTGTSESDTVPSSVSEVAPAELCTVNTKKLWENAVLRVVVS
jgi:hypothetical protein